MNNEEMIKLATAVVHPRTKGDASYGGVGAALLADSGKVYTGVCIDTISGMGFCAEAGAVAALMADGGARVEKMVAIWRDEQGKDHVLPPCGRCREFVRQIHPDNMKTVVLLGDAGERTIAELLPHPC